MTAAAATEEREIAVLLRGSALTFFPEASQPRRGEAWECILKSRIFESCSRTVVPVFSRNLTYLHEQFVGVGICYGAALGG